MHLATCFTDTNGARFVAFKTTSGVNIQEENYKLDAFYKMALFVINKMTETAVPSELFDLLSDTDQRFELSPDDQTPPLKKTKAISITIVSEQGNKAKVKYEPKTKTVNFHTWNVPLEEFLGLIYLFHNDLSFTSPENMNPKTKAFIVQILATFQPNRTRRKA